MKNKKNIIFITVIIFVITIGFFYFFSTNKTTKQNNNFFNNVQSSQLCAKEGENIGTCAGCITKCCDNLKGMAHLKYNNQCVKFPAPGSGATCSNCGNGICEKQNYEDECNCPEDCK